MDTVYGRKRGKRAFSHNFFSAAKIRRVRRFFAVCAVSALMIAVTGSCETAAGRPLPGWTKTFSVNGKTIEARYVEVPFPKEGGTLVLQAMLYRCVSDSPRYAVVMTHGRNGPHPSRLSDEVYGYEKLNTAMASEGCVVLYLVRRGYGLSEGDDSEFLPSPEESGLEGARDMFAGAAYLGNLEGCGSLPIVVMGHSQGGWVALASSCLEDASIIAAVNISGGTNYSGMGSGRIDEKVQARWVEGCAFLGALSVRPVIWIYSENDRNHPPEWVRKMFDSFIGNGGTGVLHILPPYGKNGHYIPGDPSLFLGLVFDALEKYGGSK